VRVIIYLALKSPLATTSCTSERRPGLAGLVFAMMDSMDAEVCANGDESARDGRRGFAKRGPHGIKHRQGERGPGGAEKRVAESGLRAVWVMVLELGCRA
jgi:hypothetical protein